MCFYHKSKVCWAILQIWRLWASLCDVTSLGRPSWRASVRRSPTSCHTAGPEMGPLLCSSKSSIWPCPTSAWPATASLTPHWRRYTKRGIDKLAKDTYTCTVQSVQIHMKVCTEKVVAPLFLVFLLGSFCVKPDQCFGFHICFFIKVSGCWHQKMLNNYAALFFYAKTFYMKHTHTKKKPNSKGKKEHKEQNRSKVMRRWDTGSQTVSLELWVWAGNVWRHLCRPRCGGWSWRWRSEGWHSKTRGGRWGSDTGEADEEDLDVNSVSYWEPVKVLKDGPDVFSGEGGWVFLEVGDGGGRREIWRRFWCVIATLSEVKRKWT